MPIIMALRLANIHKGLLIALTLITLLLLCGSSYGRPAVVARGITVTVTSVPVTNTFWNGNGIFDNGALFAQATGGTAPYTYTLTWDGAYDNNGYFPMLPPGT